MGKILAKLFITGSIFAWVITGYGLFQTVFNGLDVENKSLIIIAGIFYLLGSFVFLSIIAFMVFSKR